MNKEISSTTRFTTSDKFIYAMLVFIFTVLASIAILYSVANDYINLLEMLTARLDISLIVIFLVLLSELIIMWFLYIFDNNLLLEKRNFIIVNIGIIFTLFLVAFMGKYHMLPIAPFTIAVMIATVLVNKRIALVINGIVAFLLLVGYFVAVISSRVSVPIENFLLIIQSIAIGFIVIPLFSTIHTRIKIVLAGLIVAISSFVITFVFAWVIYYNYHFEDVILFATAIGLSNIIATALFMFLLPIFEWIFNTLTEFKLNEYCKFNNPLLIRLAKEAPGTFSHSILVGNLSESCAIAIGANSQLARAAGYYHDVGKLKNPNFFIENQNSSDNPHDELIPEVSAKTITAHTINGYNLLMQNRFPKEIADVAREHHGTGAMQYFYKKALLITEGKADIKNYSYDSPKPSTIVTAIVLLCDACEAAARVNGATVELVKSIIKEKLDTEQFTDCPITLKEIDIIGKTIINSLSGIYHDRISYDPKL